MKNKIAILAFAFVLTVVGCQEAGQGTNECNIQDTTSVEEVDTTTTTVVVDTIQISDTVK
jgi:protein involved in sex pheromone biosynthesis